MAIPEGFDKGIGETEDQHVIYRPFAQEVVNPENRGLVKNREQDFIQLTGRSQIVPEGFLNNHARVGSAFGTIQMFHDRFKQYRRNGQIVGGALRVL
jgi:hypothetical protein